MSWTTPSTRRARAVDSKDLAFYLQKKGAKQMQYFEFNPDMLDNGNILNPVWGRDGEPPMTWIYTGNNQLATSRARSARSGRGPRRSARRSCIPAASTCGRGLRLPRRSAAGGAAWSIKYE